MAYFLLGLGSNIEPREHLSMAVEALHHVGDIVEQSPAVFTEPVGETFSHTFGNQLIILECNLPAPMLKQRLQRIEEQLGREPKSPARKTRDRTIDIDILQEADSGATALKQTPPEESYYREVYETWNQAENV
ncbi:MULTISPECIES: 2-amino-4-hydroxy-6-hydroxymethyldihydropteridine diphosphokinase [unclassified Thalassolituus]|mgnify:FL=1|jgi:2-amino-4-hydroxy-6-hydroxymethyldihydropteridine diphosphokinase|uniref:2-amino-4-hydroxy-6- hydroxymethyldihydropteridine diphosphokinase n=1 Tax=unclassified Thalassolituus TaxID=2624967 RepID=UPI000EC8E82B|nr:MULTISPECIES: 2-amino-4-hydroxy-6-hydroxymethyldihydropteridine diphosphokinase [unclassified Thalassolituus]MEE3160503.1 2-amino-4-hydroxy-6-hydroxymethyldihydropteridine diphosphokinase [Pseudomonadota bacterium]HCG78074.1 2-amino-4-hydroxy-6-hydroxymethyldihydropteridine diphosphokinase [Oceanospirillales bacterium]|tara:strand:- start:973 stop:1371 length:399 start_codon:yes stop_codon:yes gene_type:complete